MARARDTMIGSGFVLGLVALGVVACSSSDAPTTEPNGNAGTNSGSAGKSSGGAGGSGTAGTNSGGGTTGIAGSASIAGTGGAIALGGSGGVAAGGTSTGGGGSGGAAGALGSAGATSLGGAPGGTRTPATCTTPTPSPNGAREGECDYLLQSIDFEDKYSYATAATDIEITSYGNSLGETAINSCSPYCYGKNLTVGIDMVGGGAATDQQGEVIVAFPKTGPGLPITVADKSRNALAWITFDGKTKPPFEVDVQLVFETTTGIVASSEVKKFFGAGQNVPFGPFNITNNYSYSNGCEFKYFDVTTGFPTMPANVTGIGFRITGKATAGQEWHGVAYIDHLQIRAGSAGDQPTGAGAYPFGL